LLSTPPTEFGQARGFPAMTLLGAILGIVLWPVLGYFLFRHGGCSLLGLFITGSSILLLTQLGSFNADKGTVAGAAIPGIAGLIVGPCIFIYGALSRPEE
jgi:thiol:disulfide interchange protein